MNTKSIKKLQRLQRFKRFQSFIIFLIFQSFNCLYASFSDISNVKNNGMAKSGVAVMDDVSSSLVNPAGLSLIKGKQFLFEYQKPFLGLNQPTEEVPGYHRVDLSNGFFGFATPLPKNIGVYSFYYKSFSSKNQYSENIYALCYARNLEEIFLREKEEEFSVGVSLKYLTVDYTADDYTQDFFDKYGNSSGGFSSDFGLKYSPLRGLDFGVSFLNIASSDLGLLYKNKPEKQTFLGASYKPLDSLKTSFAYSFRESYPSENYHIGSEFELFKDLFYLRLGGNRDEITSGFGFNFDKESSFFNINYSFSYPLQIEKSYGSHAIALSVEIPPIIKEIEAEEKVEVKPVLAPMPGIEEKPKELPVEEIKPPVIDKKAIMRQHYNKAIWHLQRGEDKQAIKEFEEILKYDPNHKPSLIRIDAAKKRTDKERKKEKIKSHWKQGVKLFQEKKFINARKEFESLLKIDPKHEPSKKRLELIEKELKKK